jgi:hypothetical protein
MRDIMDTMVSGRGTLYSILLPEGLTSQQIVERLRDEDILSGELPAIPAEGSLLPETYKVTRWWCWHRSWRRKPRLPTSGAASQRCSSTVCAST